MFRRGLKVKFFKLIIMVGILALSILVSNSVLAEEIGIVDVSRIVNNYTKAQEVIAVLRIKESELQKFVTDARNDLKTNTSADKKALEEKYSKELLQKSNAFKQEEIKQLSVIQEEIAQAIKKVADKKNIKSVFKKDSLILGANDLTNEVLMTLNTKQP